MALKITTNQNNSNLSIEDILQAQADDFAEHCNSSNHEVTVSTPIASGIEQVTSGHLVSLLNSPMFKELNSCSFNQLRQKIVNLTFENMTLKNEVERLTQELVDRGIDID